MSGGQPGAAGKPDAADSSSAGTPRGDGPTGETPVKEEQETIKAEESLDFESRASEIRIDFPSGGRFRDVAGVINHHHYGTGAWRGTSLGRIGVAELDRLSAAHVTAPSDNGLRDVLRARQIAIIHGAQGTGRDESAIMVLDELTGRVREASMVIMLDPAKGLDSALGQLQPECGHILDASEALWAGSIGEVHLNQAREALGDQGFLIIVADSDDIQPVSGHAVAHVSPDPEQVAVFHLAAELVEKRNAGETALAEARRQAVAIMTEACAADVSTGRWLQEIAGRSVPRPAEAVTFAEAVLDWHTRRADDPAALPLVEVFRMRHLYDQARTLLRHRHGMSSPVPQSYLIAAAVLNGLNANEVVTGAAALCVLLAHPGASTGAIFEQPLARRIKPAELAPAPTGNGTVVRMPSPELARCVIETAWREYDGVRVPMLDWLLSLCEDEDGNDDMRARAAQALACIAADDYALIRNKVLGKWAESRLAERHVTASWLLEAVVLDGASSREVLTLLRDWSRQSDYGKKAIALRAYGTSIAVAASRDATAAIHFSADMRQFSALPELALREMYRLGMVADVMAELVTWPGGLPAARRRAGQAMVRIAYVRGDGRDCPPGTYDLLWRLAHAPDQVGASVSQVAALWRVACLDEKSAKDAWRALCDWAASCVDDPEMSRVFAALAAEFEKTAHDARLRERIGKYRQWWDRHLAEENRE